MKEPPASRRSNSCQNVFLAVKFEKSPLEPMGYQGPVLAEIATRADRNVRTLVHALGIVLAEIATRADRNLTAMLDAILDSSSRDRNAGRPEPDRLASRRLRRSSRDRSAGRPERTVSWTR